MTPQQKYYKYVIDDMLDNTEYIEHPQQSITLFGYDITAFLYVRPEVIAKEILSGDFTTNDRQPDIYFAFDRMIGKYGASINDIEYVWGKYNKIVIKKIRHSF